MPLTVKLAPRETLLLNGAVLRNEPRKASLLVFNRANVLRGCEVIHEEDACTPVSQARFLMQALVIDPSLAMAVMPEFRQAMAALGHVFVNAEVLAFLGRALAHAEAGLYYKAFSALRPVAEYEKLLHAHARLRDGDPEPLKRGKWTVPQAARRATNAPISEICLRGKERVVINGAVIASLSGSVRMALMNKANILIESDILQEEQADTPVQRARFLLQVMALDPNPKSARTLMPHFRDAIGDLGRALTQDTSRTLLARALTQAEIGGYAIAFATLRPVAKYETGLLAHTLEREGVTC
jgi:flagellar protein FlbT